MMKLFDQVIEDVDILPSIPTSLNRLMRIIDDEEVSLKEVAKIISLDSSLSAKVLSIANTALYFSTKKVFDINKAVVRLGKFEVKKIIMTVFLSSFRKAISLNELNWNNFWKHSIATAIIARKIVKRYKGKDRLSQNDTSVVYISGLLSDIGILLLDAFFSEKFKEILTYAKENDLSIYEEELQVLKKNHFEEGAKMMRYWNLPEPIDQVIEFSQDPFNEKNEKENLAIIVHVASYLADHMGYSNFSDLKHQDCIPEAFEKFDFAEFSEEEFDEFIEDLKEKTEIFISLASILLN